MNQTILSLYSLGPASHPSHHSTIRLADFATTVSWLGLTHVIFTKTDGRFLLFDVEKKKTVWQMGDGLASVTQVISVDGFCEGRFAAGLADGSVQLWSRDKKVMVKSVKCG